MTPLPTRLTLATLMLFATIANAADSVFKHFVTREDDQLYDGDKPLRFISWNIPNLHNVEDAFTFLGESPWRWPNDYEIADALESTRQMGGMAVRTYVLSVQREGSDMGDHVHVLAPGEFNEEAFVALDRVLAIANQKGVRVFIPLVDQWHWWGGIRQYEAFRGKSADSFWTDPQLIADFKRTIDHLINRRNTVTGQLYKDDKAILCWETGNEIDAPASWTKEIAAYIKSIDKNHLVMDGRSLHGVPQWSLDDPNVDIVTTHHYPGAKPIPAAVRECIADAAGKKPYLIGEVGFIPNDEMRQVFDDAIQSKSIGVLVWSLRFRNRDGGFYAHSEPAAEGRYKAYHWPGFASGDAYDETELLTLMREKAFEIRGESVPDLPAPAPAELLQVEDPARIAWRGATGASSYDVQRSSSADGPWESIAQSVDDAALYYRPQYADTSAAPGESYFYRVVAKNASGAATPSNVVGPVTSTTHAIVDELANLDQVASTAGDVVPDKGNARTVQEDPSRLALSRGASITYAAPGPVVNVTVYAFGGAKTAPLVTVSQTAGRDAVPLSTTLKTPNRPAGDYGYLTPTLVEAMTESRQGRLVMISAPETVHGGIQLSRVEIRYDAP
jgi:mannan endo-1,4-beta-mannosidase